MTEVLTRETILPHLTDLFEKRGAQEYLGEKVTLSQHMLQGAHLAEHRGEPEPIVVAALLHDVGHFMTAADMDFMDDEEDRYHEDAGAALLEPFFPPLIVDCVRHHVAAKRYLCATEPDYFRRLSEASVHSLKLQGGPMSEEEVAVFEEQPNLEAIVKVRLLDDEGKVVGLETPPFAHFLPMVRRAIEAGSGA